MVSGLAMLVLLGGGATLAALVLVHYERRRPEFALKIAPGAGRWRLVSEPARESTRVGVVGSASGILAAILGSRLVPASGLPGGVDIGRLPLPEPYPPANTTGSFRHRGFASWRQFSSRHSVRSV